MKPLVIDGAAPDEAAERLGEVGKPPLLVERRQLALLVVDVMLRNETRAEHRVNRAYALCCVVHGMSLQNVDSLCAFPSNSEVREVTGRSGAHAVPRRRDMRVFPADSAASVG